MDRIQLSCNWEIYTINPDGTGLTRLTFSPGFDGVSGTGTDANLDIPLSCVPTAATPRGSDCALTTTLDALVPGMIPEGKRTILASHSFSLLDAGLDGDISASACPPTCGTGDEETFLEQGTFTP